MYNNEPQIILGTYKVIGEIGSGGGGIVYLAEHLRLNKKVVLKADKRTPAAKTESLRREVDALKGLSHTTIPQVYDFVVEDGIVYTVMDYIDGESFDKPLKRGVRYTQAQVLEWACELLEALVYLHTRPPHGILHADIKPANVMLTPQGEVRLIDFNIALALGAEGAVAVGRSFGYASPEHYGVDYSSDDKKQLVTDSVSGSASASSGATSDTETMPPAGAAPENGGTPKKKILLDVRSDIYSLGATIYHIMTGERPARDAKEVVPISDKQFSPAVVSIIAKAMNPNPDLRYKTAKEMLHALEHLRENDPRTKRFKRTVALTTAVMSILFLAGVFTAFVGLKQKEQLQNAYVLAEYSGNALRAGDAPAAINYALLALPEKRGIFTPPNTAEAQKALTDALNVYDLSDGFKTHRVVELPSAPLYMSISPSGKTASCVYAYSVAIFNTDTAEIIATLPTEQSALSEVKYAGENIILYAGDGGIRAYDIAKGEELWKGKPATSITVSADNKTAAAVYKDETFATVYNIESGKVIKDVSFGNKHQSVTVNDVFANPNDNLFALNQDGTMLGASFADGSLLVYDLLNSDGDLEIFDSASGYNHFEGGFFEQYFAFSASDAGGSVFAVIDTVQLVQTGGFESDVPFGVQTDNTGVYVQTENVLVNLNPLTGEQKALVQTNEDITRFARSENHTFITTDTGYMVYDKNLVLISQGEKEHKNSFIQIAEDIALLGTLDAPAIRVLKLEKHTDAEVFAYDSTFFHDEARISDETVMLYSYDRFRLYGIDGDIITEVNIPDADQVYDQQFRRNENGAFLEVIYNDGTINTYSAKDGALMGEEKGEKPDPMLYEEFFTANIRIEAPLHGTPTAYDKNSGKLVRELEKDAYLTYVTQVGEYLVTEYITAEGDRYGLLLNEKCETLAYLPYLCDVVGEVLFFDYPTGNLRKTGIYSLSELLELASDSLY